MIEEKTIVIIGCGSGIGRSLFDLLADTNFQIIACENDEIKVKSLQQTQSDKKENIEIIQFDICNSSNREKLAKLIHDKYKEIYALVISAGKHSTSPVEYVLDNDIDQIIDVNLISHIKLVRDLLPYIRENGKIIGISSLAGCMGVPMSSIYSASKFGLEGFYETLWYDTKYRKIYPSIIQIGAVNTGFNETGNNFKSNTSEYLSKAYSQVISKIHSKNGISPYNVAKIIAKILKTRKPKFQYIIGLNAKKAYYARWLLGRKWAMLLMKKYFQL
ncbi:MAG: SDR family NAD(P)-dependent oxidoreductase [Leptospiraceae bacterium]|nr:SDR family NAD(P)-dependent oxidoreductase [Leptospiraceae bacterium]